jgi:hypothetical protein
MIQIRLLPLLIAAQMALPPRPAEQPNASLLREVVASGRCASVGASPSERISPPLQIAPGAPPLLSFRYYEGRARHRFGETDLVLDDAGH